MRAIRRTAVVLRGRAVVAPLFAALLCAMLGSRAAAQEESVEEILATMKKAILEKNDPMRNRMFFKLRRIGAPAVQPLCTMLADPEAGVSEYAAFTLSWIADTQAVEPLVAYLEKGSVSQKRAALHALGNMAWGTEEKVRKVVHEKAVPKMIAELDNKEAAVKRDAAYALGLAGDPKAIEPLRKLVEDKDALLAFLANEAIERIEQVNKKK